MPFIVLVILAVILLFPGVFITIVPGIIGVLYMLLIAVIFGLLDGFVHLSGLELTILAALSLLIILVEFFAGIIGAKWGGAHWTSILWGIVGLVVGMFVIPIPIVGSLLGMFIGVLVAEWYRTKDVRRANTAAVGSFLGWLAGTGFKVGAAIVFLTLFVVFVNI